MHPLPECVGSTHHHCASISKRSFQHYTPGHLLPHTPQHESRKNTADRFKDTIILQKKSCMTRAEIQSKGQSTHRADIAICLVLTTLQTELCIFPQRTPPLKAESKVHYRVTPEVFSGNFPQTKVIFFSKLGISGS